MSYEFRDDAAVDTHDMLPATSGGNDYIKCILLKYALPETAPEALVVSHKSLGAKPRIFA